MDQLSRLFSQIILTPLLTRFLGQEIFGAWALLLQASGHIAALDFRTAGTLKYFLTLRQHSSDIGEKQRLLGAALWFLRNTMPVAAAIVLAAIYLFPSAVTTASLPESEIRTALTILFSWTILERYGSIPQNILRAQNLEYRGAGIGAVGNLVGGSLLVLVAYWGFGLVGLAMTVLVVGITSTLFRLRLATTSLDWLKVLPPDASDKTLFRQTATYHWCAAIGSLLCFSLDQILVSCLMSVSASAILVCTAIPIRIVGQVVLQMIGSMSIGITGLLAKGETERASRVMTESRVISICLVASSLVFLTITCRPLVTHWVGSNYFAGNVFVLFFSLSIYATVQYRILSIVPDALASPRKRGLSLLAVGIGSLLGQAYFVTQFGLVGIALSLCLVASFLWILNEYWTRTLVPSHLYQVKMHLLAVAAVLAGSLVESAFPAPMPLLFSLAIVAAVLSGIALLCASPRSTRLAVIERFKLLKSRLKK